MLIQITSVIRPKRQNFCHIQYCKFLSKKTHTHTGAKQCLQVLIIIEITSKQAFIDTTTFGTTSYFVFAKQLHEVHSGCTFNVLFLMNRLPT